MRHHKTWLNEKVSCPTVALRVGFSHISTPLGGLNVLFRIESSNIRIKTKGNRLVINSLTTDDVGDWTCYNEDSNYTGIII